MHHSPGLIGFIIGLIGFIIGLIGFIIGLFCKMSG